MTTRESRKPYGIGRAAVPQLHLHLEMICRRLKAAGITSRPWIARHGEFARVYLDTDPGMTAYIEVLEIDADPNAVDDDEACGVMSGAALKVFSDYWCNAMRGPPERVANRCKRVKHGLMIRFRDAGLLGNATVCDDWREVGQ